MIGLSLAVFKIKVFIGIGI